MSMVKTMNYSLTLHAVISVVKWIRRLIPKSTAIERVESVHVNANVESIIYPILSVMISV